MESPSPSDFLIDKQIKGQYPHQWAPFQLAGLLHTWQIYTIYPGVPIMRVDCQRFHSLQSLSVSCPQVILGLSGPHSPSTCMSKAVLTASVEHSTCPYQQSLLSFRMRSRSSMPLCASSSVDLTVAVSLGFTLQICLIIRVATHY